jgi:hypothetical protein
MCMFLYEGFMGLSGIILIYLFVTMRMVLRFASYGGALQSNTGASVYAYCSRLGVRQRRRILSRYAFQAASDNTEKTLRVRIVLEKR